MKITRAYQFRLYPTKEQEVLIHKTFGCTRFLYNQMLDEKKKDKTLSKYDLFKKIPGYIKNYPFLIVLDVFNLFDRNLYYSNTFYFAIILECIFLKVLGTSWTLRQQFGTIFLGGFYESIKSNRTLCYFDI